MTNVGRTPMLTADARTMSREGTEAIAAYTPWPGVTNAASGTMFAVG